MFMSIKLAICSAIGRGNNALLNEEQAASIVFESSHDLQSNHSGTGVINHPEGAAGSVMASSVSLSVEKHLSVVERVIGVERKRPLSHKDRKFSHLPKPHSLVRRLNS